MTLFEAFILGIVQGLTEFLPISSSGHLELGKAFLGISEEKSLLFTVVVHGATVMSTILVFRNEIKKLFIDFFQFKWNESTKLILKLAVSAIPIGIIGFFFEREIETNFFGNILLVGIMLLVTGIFLVFSYFSKNNNKDVNYSNSFVIGLSQVFAIIPGISRSGITIAIALLLGVKREMAAKFSFLMVLAPIIAANIKTILTTDLNGNSIGLFPIMTGFVVAFISGYIACKWMIKIVQKGKLIFFAYYCFLLGMVTILSSL